MNKDTRGGVTALNHADLNELARIAKENQSKLDACSGHRFVDVIFSKTYRCMNCDGTVDHHALYWYYQGRKHEAAISGQS